MLFVVTIIQKPSPGVDPDLRVYDGGMPGNPWVSRGSLPGAEFKVPVGSLPRRLPWLTHTHPPDDAAAGNGGVHHRDGLGELALEHTAGTRTRGSRA